MKRAKSMVAIHVTEVPLGPPNHSRFPFLVVLGKIRILLICHHLAVFCSVFLQGGIGRQDVYAQGN